MGTKTRILLHFMKHSFCVCVLRRLGWLVHVWMDKEWTNAFQMIHTFFERRKQVLSYYCLTFNVILTWDFGIQAFEGLQNISSFHWDGCLLPLLQGPCLNSRNSLSRQNPSQGFTLQQQKHPTAMTLWNSHGNSVPWGHVLMACQGGLFERQLEFDDPSRGAHDYIGSS